MPCYSIHRKDGGKAILCGDLGPHCGDANCGDVGTYLCDYPVGDDKTCDMPLCHGHAFEAAPNIHYCPGHALLWREFRAAGGVTRELENVVPYKSKESTNEGS
ncbi:hypothetical protein [Dyella sp. 2RAB6]|uniref:hypothetical protein n=1 Tax=Dyella sp. 2RAB6 TaxID=3232992 RepID=UPI003F8EAF80